MRIIFKGKSYEINLPWAVRLSTLTANIAMILGIVFAIFQYLQTKENNKRLFAIDAVNRFYNSEFLKSTAFINTPDNADTTSIQYIDASNCIFNTYYLIAIIYNGKMAENEIISKAIKFELDIYVKSRSFKKKSNTYVCKEILAMDESIKLNDK
jgi:hypothetical protein